MKTMTEETFAERRIFALNAERWAAFQSALDAPTHALPRLQKVLEEPGFSALVLSNERSARCTAMRPLHSFA
jgi:hypothetical protein